MYGGGGGDVYDGGAGDDMAFFRHRLRVLQLQGNCKELWHSYSTCSSIFYLCAIGDNYFGFCQNHFQQQCDCYCSKNHLTRSSDWLRCLKRNTTKSWTTPNLSHILLWSYLMERTRLPCIVQKQLSKWRKWLQCSIEENMLIKWIYCNQYLKNNKKNSFYLHFQYICNRQSCNVN